VRTLQENIPDQDRKLANIPENLAPDELTLAKAIELLAAPSGERELGTDPSTGLEVVAKSGRFGPYITEIFPEPPVELNDKGEVKKKRKKADAPKPKTASLLSNMNLDTITLDDALRLLISSSRAWHKLAQEMKSLCRTAATVRISKPVQIHAHSHLKISSSQSI
jgi:DNA topoisomerase I